MSDMNPVDEVSELFLGGGGRQYGGEAVTQLAHALQCALTAETEHASPALITAALLHDIGHLTHRLGPRPAARGIDDRHEQGGADYLASRFEPAVSEPVRLHVDAKRYLCAVEPGYFASLSPESVRSLELQGGVFSTAEAEEFIRRPFAADAVRLRRWDEQAKIKGLKTPDLAHFKIYLAKCLKQ
ncbi:MAG TPA: HD domain-containing protein [Stellaceae bacterium]|nr:HD domain-containing protein [Stellaceae bacterium]